MPPSRGRDPAGDLRMGLGWRAILLITCSRLLLRASGLPLHPGLSHILAGKGNLSLPASLRQASRPVGRSRGGHPPPWDALAPGNPSL